MNEKLIKQLREGTIAVENDGTLDDLIKILQYAFPNDKCKIFGDCKYYSKLDYTESIWIGKNRIDLPTYSVKEFLTQEKQIMKVTDLKENECIHCETEEQAVAICKLMHEAGLKWRNGKTYLYYNDYNTYKSETCYIPKEGTYCSLKYVKRRNYTIYKVEQFLTQEAEIMNTIVNINPDTSENEYPKVMKVSNKPIETSEDFKNANTRVVFMEKCGKFIAWLHVNTIERSENVTSTAVWNYAVDLDWQPEEEKKPLKLTMEQIAEKFNAERIEIVNYENKYNEYV